jgi:hypothetical protein
LCSVGHHHVDEQPRDFIRFEEAHLHQDISGDEVSGLACSSTMGYSQEITSAAKAVEILAALAAGLNACSTGRPNNPNNTVYRSFPLT